MWCQKSMICMLTLCGNIIWEPKKLENSSINVFLHLQKIKIFWDLVSGQLQMRWLWGSSSKEPGCPAQYFRQWTRSPARDAQSCVFPHDHSMSAQHRHGPTSLPFSFECLCLHKYIVVVAYFDCLKWPVDSSVTFLSLLQINPLLKM